MVFHHNRKLRRSGKARGKEWGPTRSHAHQPGSLILIIKCLYIKWLFTLCWQSSWHLLIVLEFLASQLGWGFSQTLAWQSPSSSVVLMISLSSHPDSLLHSTGSPRWNTFANHKLSQPLTGGLLVVAAAELGSQKPLTLSNVSSRFS